MKSILQSRFGWLWVLLVLAAVNILATRYHGKWDLTAEKRFTISPATEKLLRNLEAPVDITVYLQGDMPAGFRKLSRGTEDLLRSFRDVSGNLVQFRFQDPLAGLADSLAVMMQDSLANYGINPTNVKAQTKQGEEQQLVFPGMMVRQDDRQIGVDLLQGLSATDGLNSLNSAEALLEYKVASAIHAVTRDSLPEIAYLIGNGQPDSYEIYDAITSLQQEYPLRIIDIDSLEVLPVSTKALIIDKPSKRFSELQKLKIDQYVMNGGKVIWMIDNLYASMDSLQRSEGSFVAFDLGLNLEDQLFKYGVRINQDLVQDLNCDKIPSVFGNMGGKPQIQVLPWPYYPLVANGDGHPISKNLDYVLMQFPSSIDTVKSAGISRRVLLATSSESRILPTPARVEWASVRNEEDLKTFTRKQVPVAVLLEGRFESLFRNRLSSEDANRLQAAGQPFRAESPDAHQMIVISDGDLITNEVTQAEGPLPMGMNPYTKMKYANKEFFLNCLEYLTDPSGILEARGKDYTLRLLDTKKVEESRSTWQFLAIGAPVVLVLLFGFIYQALRKRRYQA